EDLDALLGQHPGHHRRDLRVVRLEEPLTALHERDPGAAVAEQLAHLDGDASRSDDGHTLWDPAELERSRAGEEVDLPEPRDVRYRGGRPGGEGGRAAADWPVGGQYGRHDDASGPRLPQGQATLLDQ